MKTVKLFLTLILLSASSLVIKAQMNYWTMPDKIFNTNPSTLTSTSISSGSTPYSVANGAYDEDGNMLFYVQDYTIYDASSSSIGDLGWINASSCTEAYSIPNTEIVIVPKPEKCDEFYVFYGMDNPTGSTVLAYVEVDCSGSTPTVVYSGSVFRSCSGFAGFIDEGFQVANHYALDHMGLAVSKWDDSESKRYLYAVNYDGIKYSEISTSGVSAGAITATSSSLGLSSFTDFNSLEAELSWNDNYFAWTSTNDKVHIIEVGNGSYTSGSIQSYTVESPRGLEFNNAATNPKLYVSGGAGITQILTTNQTSSTISTGSYDLTNTYLEYAKNGKIYGVSPTYSGSTLTNTTLVGINPSNNSLSASSSGIDSRYLLSGSYPYDVFTLPDQIDGENYDWFIGFDPIVYESFTINGNIATNKCAGKVYSYCLNEAINLYWNYSGDVTGYSYSIFSVNEDCEYDEEFLYYSDFLSGYPTEIELIDFLSSISQTLKLRIEISLFGPCGQEYNDYGYFEVIKPVPPVTNLEIYDYNNSQVYLTASTDINNPNPVGASSIGFRISNSTGSIEELRVEVDEVNSSGTVIQSIYDETTTVSGVSGYTYENLNGYCVPTAVWTNGNSGTACSGGYEGYFSYTNAVTGPSYLGTLYRIRVTLSNQCNSSTAFAYVEITERWLRVKRELETEESSFKSLSVYPNPSKGLLNFEWSLIEESNLSIELYDILGKKVQTLHQSNTGLTDKRQFDISHLESGMYIYRFIVNGKTKSGLINKQ